MTDEKKQVVIQPGEETYRRLVEGAFKPGVSTATMAKLFEQTGLSSVIKEMKDRQALSYSLEPHKPIKIAPINWDQVYAYASAKALLTSLQRYYDAWSERVAGENVEIAIYAFLANGSIVRVHTLIEEGYNGVAIEGEINGLPCVLLQNQSSLQFCCVAETPESSKGEEAVRKPIGFIFANVETPV